MPRHPLANRDSQQSKVYAWEQEVVANYRTTNLISSYDVIQLVRNVLRDAQQGGAFVPPHTTVVKFTKRAGGACASWKHGANFTLLPGRVVPKAIVLHEIAHILTYAPGWQFVGALKNDPWQFDDEGHGARYTACLIALFERYLGIPAGDACKKARSFKIMTWGPYRIRTGTYANGNTWMQRIRQRDRETWTSVRVSLDALARWRRVLGSDVQVAA